MKDFILGALPWVVCGLTAAIALVTISRKYKKKDNQKAADILEDMQGSKTTDESDNYMAMGMSLGMSTGVAIGTALMNVIGTEAISYGLCFGMIIGMIVGMNIKRKK